MFAMMELQLPLGLSAACLQHACLGCHDVKLTAHEDVEGAHCITRMVHG